MLEGMIELNQFEVDDKVTKKNKLKGITEITLNLDELDNSDNLKDHDGKICLQMVHLVKIFSH